MSDACHFQVTVIECSLKQYLLVYICINLTNLEYNEKTCDFEVEFGIHVGEIYNYSAYNLSQNMEGNGEIKGVDG